jgi:2-methylisocitrate lyase-like PEP mutase family enzyme
VRRRACSAAATAWVTRHEALDHARAIVAATDLPVSGDLEKGFDDAPEGAAETIRLAATVGLVGGSITTAATHKSCCSI